MIAELLFGFLRAFLPWFFSGETKREIYHTAGLTGMDRDTLSGKNELKDFIPKLCLAFALALSLTSCGPSVNIGGSTETIRAVLVEPGDTLEIAEDDAIDCIVRFKDKDGKDQEKITKKRMAGTVAMPKSVYQTMQKFWEEGHPK